MADATSVPEAQDGEEKECATSLPATQAEEDQATTAPRQGITCMLDVREMVLPLVLIFPFTCLLHISTQRPHTHDKLYAPTSTGDLLDRYIASCTSLEGSNRVLAAQSQAGTVEAVSRRILRCARFRKLFLNSFLLVPPSFHRSIHHIALHQEVVSMAPLSVPTMPLQPAYTGFAVVTPQNSLRCRVVRGRRYRPLRRKRKDPSTLVAALASARVRSTHDIELVCPIPQTVATVKPVVPTKKTPKCKHPRLRAAVLSSRFCTRGMRYGSIRGGALEGGRAEEVWPVKTKVETDSSQMRN